MSRRVFQLMERKAELEKYNEEILSANKKLTQDNEKLKNCVVELFVYLLVSRPFDNGKFELMQRLIRIVNINI